MPDKEKKASRSEQPTFNNNSFSHKDTQNLVTVSGDGFDRLITSPLIHFLGSIKNGTPKPPFIKSKPQKVCFAEVKDNAVKSPTHILVFVYKYPSEIDLNRSISFFEGNEYVRACFRSVPPNHLIVLVKCQPTTTNALYLERHSVVGRYFNKPYLSSEGVGILQAIPFDSDPDLYLNEYSRIWGEAEQAKTPIQVKPFIDNKPVLSADTQLLSVNDSVIRDIASERGVMFNELTQELEDANGTPLSNRDICDMTIQARSVIKNISDPAIIRVLNSNLTPSFHPFPLYISSIKDRPVVHGTIEKFLNCLILDDHHPDYLLRIVKKWFGGLMGTLMGSYSVMTLVFVGRQGNGKTVFFRYVLLPPALRRYFVESEILQDKDIMARLCSNLILYDDEFTSKNKTEASQQKKMASAEYFTYRKAYGRIDETRKRTAVLCGSANEQDVISDCTGNRRIIPVRLKHIDHEKLSTINIDDFYRELLELHLSNPVWWHLSSDDIAFMNADTVQNTAIDEFEERVSRWTASDPDGHISTTEVSRHLAAYDGSYRPNIPKLSRALTRVYGNSCIKNVNDKSIRGYKLRLIGN